MCFILFWMVCHVFLFSPHFPPPPVVWGGGGALNFVLDIAPPQDEGEHFKFLQSAPPWATPQFEGEHSRIWDFSKHQYAIPQIFFARWRAPIFTWFFLQWDDYESVGRVPLLVLIIRAKWLLTYWLLFLFKINLLLFKIIKYKIRYYLLSWEN